MLPIGVPIWKIKSYRNLFHFSFEFFFVGSNLGYTPSFQYLYWSPVSQLSSTKRLTGVCYPDNRGLAHLHVLEYNFRQGIGLQIMDSYGRKINDLHQPDTIYISLFISVLDNVCTMITKLILWFPYFQKKSQLSQESICQNFNWLLLQTHYG